MTTTDVSGRRSSREIQDIVWTSLAVIGGGLLLPGVGLILALIFSRTVLRRERVPSHVLIVIGGLFLLGPLLAITGTSSTWVGPVHAAQ